MQTKGPIIGVLKAVKLCKNQPKAAIRNKIKRKAAAAMVKGALLHSLLKSGGHGPSAP